MMILRVLFLLIFSGSMTSAVADVMLLVHGYQSDADDWRNSGVIRQLKRGGWVDAGVIYSASSQVLLSSKPLIVPKKIYTAQLQAQYPLMLQSQLLLRYLQAVMRLYPDEAIVLVGHSAGGVVARAALVSARLSMPVVKLITIASPHLGTNAAKLGLFTANSPLGMFTPFIGAGAINRSEQLYRDLLPETPGSLLFALNRQPHPRIEYISIVRAAAFGLPTDFIVPEESQHLEAVYALRGSARSVIFGRGHRLRENDGYLLLQLLQEPHFL